METAQAQIKTVDEMFKAIDEGYYTHKEYMIPLPTKPQSNPLYGKPQSELTEDEAYILRAEEKTYSIRLKRAVQMREEYFRNLAERTQQFWDDAARVCGVAGNPKRSLLEDYVKNLLLMLDESTDYHRLTFQHYVNAAKLIA